jgi:hypothetical protein
VEKKIVPQWYTCSFSGRCFAPEWFPLAFLYILTDFSHSAHYTPNPIDRQEARKVQRPRGNGKAGNAVAASAACRRKMTAFDGI